MRRKFHFPLLTSLPPASKFQIFSRCLALSLASTVYGFLILYPLYAALLVRFFLRSVSLLASSLLAASSARAHLLQPYPPAALLLKKEKSGRRSLVLLISYAHRVLIRWSSPSSHRLPQQRSTALPVRPSFPPLQPPNRPLGFFLAAARCSFYTHAAFFNLQRCVWFPTLPSGSPDCAATPSPASLLRPSPSPSAGSRPPWRSVARPPIPPPCAQDPPRLHLPLSCSSSCAPRFFSCAFLSRADLSPPRRFSLLLHAMASPCSLALCRACPCARSAHHSKLALLPAARPVELPDRRAVNIPAGACLLVHASPSSSLMFTYHEVPPASWLPNSF
jgi:hypothetical protein